MKPDYYRAQVPNLGPDREANPECVVMATHLIDALGLTYHEGTAFAYLWRKGKVPPQDAFDIPPGEPERSRSRAAWIRLCRQADLRKAITHLEFELDRLVREAEDGA